MENNDDDYKSAKYNDPLASDKLLNVSKVDLRNHIDRNFERNAYLNNQLTYINSLQIKKSELEKLLKNKENECYSKRYNETEYPEYDLKACLEETDKIKKNIDDISNEIEQATDRYRAIQKSYLILDGGKKSKNNSKKVSKKPVVSQKKESVYKEILGKQMKIYKMPNSRKEYVKYKGELHLISDYKSLMKQKAKPKPKPKSKK